MDGSFTYRGWSCAWDSEEEVYRLYTPEEREQPPGFREEEYACASEADCRVFIDSYYDFCDEEE